LRLADLRLVVFHQHLPFLITGRNLLDARQVILSFENLYPGAGCSDGFLLYSTCSN